MIQHLIHVRAHRKLAAMAAILIWFAMPGCATVKQVQYFEVVGEPDPLTGIAPKNYYRMTIEGWGGWGADFKLNAAYVSAVTVDTLDGKIPLVPEADLSEESENEFQKIRAAYLKTLVDYAEAVAQSPASEARGQERSVLEIARQAWFAGFNDQDLISLGQVKSADPYRFRKLVFYTSAKNIKLDQYNQQINSVLDKTGALARLFKQQRDNRNNRREQRMGALSRIIDKMQDQETAAMLRGLFPELPGAVPSRN
ncbi:MAG: hypothetical protein KAV82_00350 [Phycisphaerae bacterium]|nr:hypothetical protein [Phycisphaerae bacterium]